MPHSSWRTEDASGHRTALSATPSCVPRAFDFNAEDRFQPIRAIRMLLVNSKPHPSSELPTCFYRPATPCAAARER